MAFVIADRVRETTTTTGTGSVTLAGAYTSFQTFSAAIGNANNTYYTIASAVNGEWEVGIGTYSSGGNLLSRDTVLSSSNAGSLVNFSVGTKDVFVTQPSKRSLLLQSGGTGLFAGAAAFTSGGVVYANATTTATTSSNLTFDGTTLTANALTTTSTVTINGGTANGVAYLNGSKVLTTGSVLTFDGTSLGVGIAPAAKLDVSGVSGGIVYFRGTGDAYQEIAGGGRTPGTGSLLVGQGNAGEAYLWNRFNSYTAFGVNNAEQMRLTSTGLGIGTSSPGSKLHIDGNFIRIEQSGANTAYFGNAADLITGAPAGAAIRFNNTALRIAYSSTQIAMFDASGNLGLGVTPSAWGSGIKSYQVGNYTALTNNQGGYTWLSNNAYYDTAWKYLTTNRALYYAQDTGDGGHKWYTAPSGTAGNAITFTQAMTLDASGNLGLGTTSPADSAGFGRTLDVSGGAAQGAAVYVRAAASATNYLALGQDTGGNSYLLNRANAAMLFYTNNTERARIDSSGNFLVAQTGQGPANSYSMCYGAGNTGGLDLSHTSGAASGTMYARFNYNATTIGSITQNGTTAVAYNTSSDYRLKHDIAPMTGALAKVAALKPCTYKWNADNSAGEGFIAHELAEVCPSAVSGEKDAVNEDGSIKPQGIDTSFLVATLTAAIQELKAEFDAYKATHP